MGGTVRGKKGTAAKDGEDRLILLLKILPPVLKALAALLTAAVPIVYALVGYHP
jgi:hypothetical protein